MMNVYFMLKMIGTPRLAGLSLAFVLLVPATNAAAGDAVERTGNALELILPACGIVATIGHQDAQGAWQFAESAALTVGATTALKYLVDETRPNGGAHSFPSGHTSISFASAEFLRHRYGWRFGLPAYGVATFVAYSRVEANQHYVHDTIAGAALGIGSSLLFTRPYHSFHVEPEVGHKSAAIMFTRQW
jgi:membrane-associated phospholipid phosphatase